MRRHTKDRPADRTVCNRSNNVPIATIVTNCQSRFLAFLVKRDEQFAFRHDIPAAFDSDKPRILEIICNILVASFRLQLKRILLIIATAIILSSHNPFIVRMGAAHFKSSPGIRPDGVTETVLESGAVDSSRYRKGKGDICLKWLLWTERICVMMEKACKKCKYNQLYVALNTTICT